jgi:hypothetical protein
VVDSREKQAVVCMPSFWTNIVRPDWVVADLVVTYM